MTSKIIASILMATLCNLATAEIAPLPEKVPCAVADQQAFKMPDQVHLGGWLGNRIDGNEMNRLVKMDTDRLLEGYRKRPGRQTWDGEHVGKWLHAATLGGRFVFSLKTRQK